jgi:hypothetical protein
LIHIYADDGFYFVIALLNSVFNSVLNSEIDVFLSANINVVVMNMEATSGMISVITISGSNNLNVLEIPQPPIMAIAVFAI